MLLKCGPNELLSSMSNTPKPDTRHYMRTEQVTVDLNVSQCKNTDPTAVNNKQLQLLLLPGSPIQAQLERSRKAMIIMTRRPLCGGSV